MKIIDCDRIIKKAVLSIILGIFIFIPVVLQATPYQLIVNENALLIPHMNFEVKENIIFSEGYLDDWTLRTQLRTGLWGIGEFSVASAFSYFPGINSPDDLFLYFYQENGYDTSDLDIDNPRLSYVEPKLKFQTITLRKNSELVLYLKYRKYFGTPLIGAYSENGSDPDAIAVTSATAQAGSDITSGAVTKFLFNMNSYTILMLVVGTEFVYLHDKDWQEPRRESSYMPVLMVSPAMISSGKWLFQIENRFEFWIDRGWHYEMIPGLRWEIQSRTVFEFGLGLPILGGDVSRYIFGFTYEFGESQILSAISKDDKKGKK